jgi:glycerol uptake facilitator-like aquaporin
MFGVYNPLRWCKHSPVLPSAMLLWLWSILPAGAQQLPPVTPRKNPDSGENLVQFFTAKTPYEFWLSCLIALLGLTIIGALVIALKRADNARPEDFARPIIVVTVIIGTLILVTVGYSNEQIAPAFGLFGTIVGYMLGRLSQTQPSTDLSPDQQQDGSRGRPSAGLRGQTSAQRGNKEPAP